MPDRGPDLFDKVRVPPGDPIAHARAAVPWPEVADQLNATVIRRVIQRDLRVGDRGHKLRRSGALHCGVGSLPSSILPFDRAAAPAYALAKPAVDAGKTEEGTHEPIAS